MGGREGGRLGSKSKWREERRGRGSRRKREKGRGGGKGGRVRGRDGQYNATVIDTTNTDTCSIDT